MAQAQTKWFTKYESANGPAAAVYPYPYTEEGRWGAFAEFLGFDWDSFSSQQKADIQAETEIAMIMHDNNCVRNLAYGIPGEDSWDWLKALDDAVIQLFGGNTIYAIALTNTDYEYAQDIFEYWAYPRKGEVSDGSTGDLVLNYFDKGIVFDANNSADSSYMAGTIGGVFYRFVTVKNGKNEIFPLVAPPITVRLSSFVSQKVTEGYKVYITCYPTSSYTSLEYSIALYKGVPTITSNDVTYAGHTYSYLTYSFDYTADGGLYFSESKSLVPLGDGVFKIRDDALSLQNFTRTLVQGYRTYDAPSAWDNFTSQQPYVPIPDPESTPPDAPTPSTPVQPDKPDGGNPPVLPTPENPTYPLQPTPPTEPTFTADLQGILDAMAEHCIHLQNALYLNFSGFWSALSADLDSEFAATRSYMSSLGAYVVGDLDDGFSYLGDTIESNLTWAVGVIGGLIRWLDHDMNYVFDEQTARIVKWLRMIYSRLGGTGTTKPDPTLDEPGFWDWVLKQFQDFFEDMVGESAGIVSDLFDALKGLFPFSIPWDLAFLMGLLVHEPVTPVYDLPMPVPSYFSSSQMILIHIDCTPWDGVASAIRAMELIFFAYKLAQMVPSWFNTIKVGGM